jgi:diaminobutyrate-2-oxoglutarate transaminase
MNILERYETVAQHYVRTAPILFERARGAEMFDENGVRYIDFHSGGGSLTMGHNDLKVCSALIDYLCADGITQTRDRASVAKRRFVEAFVSNVLAPRRLDYKLLFTEPASGMAAEQALRIARREKKRGTVLAFTNASHGVTEGALSVTSRPVLAGDRPEPRGNTVFLPYCGYLGPQTDTTAYLRRYFEDSASGIERPAAVIVETVQWEGGVQIATISWLQALERLCREFGMLLIVDETRMECGRTGTYFSFERAGIAPDMILTGGAIAGGRPLSLLLLRPGLDQWRPGELTGLFQGETLAFVAAAELATRWKGEGLTAEILKRGESVGERLNALALRFPKNVRVRGLGMMWALDFERPAAATVVSSWALEKGLIVEAAGLKDNVLVVAPPVTIEDQILRTGLDHLEDVVCSFLGHERK